VFLPLGIFRLCLHDDFEETMGKVRIRLPNVCLRFQELRAPREHESLERQT